jgi:hypothetical protein
VFRWRQIDRGTDVVAIRVRRLAMVIPAAAGVIADLFVPTFAAVLVTVVLWVASLAAIVWLFLRPWRSPLVPTLIETVEHGDLELTRRTLERGLEPRGDEWDRPLVDAALRQRDVHMAHLLFVFGARRLDAPA